MATIVVNTKNSEELDLIKGLLKKMRVKSKEIVLEKEEDLFLGQMMIAEKTGIKVSKESVIKKLKDCHF